MFDVFFTSLSGWVLVVLLTATVSLPYLVRGGALSSANGRSLPFLQRLRPHYWLGYGIAGLTFIHAYVPMSATWARRINASGLYLATGALLLVCTQVLLGLRLQKPGVIQRRGLRRVHFWMMAGIIALVLGHIALNSPMLQVFLR